MPAPVASSPQQSKRPIINTNALISNVVTGGVIGAVFAPKPINVVPEAVMEAGQVRDEFLGRVAKLSGEEQGKTFTTILETFDNAFAPFKNAVDEILKKLKSAETAELAKEFKATGEAIKNAAKDLANCPEELRPIIEALENAKPYSINEIKLLGLSAQSVSQPGIKALESVKNYIDGFKPKRGGSAILYAGVFALASIVIDLIAATARNSKSQK